MKYSFIREHKGIFPIRLQCRLLGVSSGGYYAFCQRPARAKHHEDLLGEIRQLFESSDRSYGSPRITGALRKRGFTGHLQERQFRFLAVLTPIARKGIVAL